MHRNAALIALCSALVVACVVTANAVEYYKFDGRWGSYGTGAGLPAAPS